VASWPRAIVPFEVTSLEMPGPLISKSQSGRVNLRATQQIGRTWTERYLVNVRSVNGRALLAFVDNVWRNGTTFTIDHRDHLTPLGAGGGAPLVNSTQLVTDPENFGLWTVGGIVGRTSGQSDPLGGTGAYLLDSNTPGTGDAISEAITYTANGEKSAAISFKQGTSTTNDFLFYDQTVATERSRVRVTWTAGVPALSRVSGTGTLYAPESQGSGWWRCSASCIGIIAANANRLYIYPDATAGGGTVYAFGANAWNSPYPIAYRSSLGAAAQTGSLLVMDGVTASISNWLRAGDIFTVSGLLPSYEVTADISTVAGGHVQVPINPPIFTGGAPADNAVVTITGVTLTACILEPPTYPTTSGPSADYGELQIKFSESL
jgi:hypothetical protein